MPGKMEKATASYPALQVLDCRIPAIFRPAGTKTLKAHALCKVYVGLNVEFIVKLLLLYIKNIKKIGDTIYL
jgi:hypothetical protein